MYYTRKLVRIFIILTGIAIISISSSYATDSQSSDLYLNQYDVYSDSVLVMLKVKADYPKTFNDKSEKNATPVPQFQGQCSQHSDCGVGW